MPRPLFLSPSLPRLVEEDCPHASCLPEVLIFLGTVRRPEQAVVSVRYLSSVEPSDVVNDVRLFRRHLRSRWEWYQVKLIGDFALYLKLVVRLVLAFEGSGALL